MPSILAVCSGNICRSPVLEKLLQKALGDRAEVRSAGTLGLNGYPPYGVCEALATEFGVDLTDFTSTALSEELITGADFILVLERAHRRVVEQVHGLHRGLFMTSDFLPEDFERVLRFQRASAPVTVVRGASIPDPMGTPPEEVRPVLEILQLAVDGFVAWLEEHGYLG